MAMTQLDGGSLTVAGWGVLILGVLLTWLSAAWEPGFDTSSAAIEIAANAQLGGTLLIVLGIALLVIGWSYTDPDAPEPTTDYSDIADDSDIED